MGCSVSTAETVSRPMVKSESSNILNVSEGISEIVCTQDVMDCLLRSYETIVDKNRIKKHRRLLPIMRNLIENVIFFKDGMTSPSYPQKLSTINNVCRGEEVLYMIYLKYTEQTILDYIKVLISQNSGAFDKVVSYCNTTLLLASIYLNFRKVTELLVANYIDVLNMGYQYPPSYKRENSRSYDGKWAFYFVLEKQWIDIAEQMMINKPEECNITMRYFKKFSITGVSPFDISLKLSDNYEFLNKMISTFPCIINFYNLAILCENRIESSAIHMLNEYINITQQSPRARKHSVINDINLNLEHIDKWQMTVLAYALESKLSRVCLKILENDPKRCRLDHIISNDETFHHGSVVDRRSMLMLAIIYDLEEVALKMLDYPLYVNLNYRDEDGFSAYNYAISKDMRSVIDKITEIIHSVT